MSSIRPGMDKIVHLEPYFPTGEATVQPVMLWANGKPCYEGISKHASVGSEFFKTITPVPGHSFVYVIALGSWETYGENRNGDAFPEFSYMETANPPWIAADEVLTAHYKTFEQFGHNYRHHANKDPKKAVGRVVKAFWNAPMHRVELLIDLVNSKAPDLAERIAAGEFPPVSMGTRVQWDVCSICGNRAPTRAHYCDHLKFQMRQVIKDKKVCALNPSPKFFDISWVFRPADATAFMMKKVARDTSYSLISGAAAGEYLNKVSSQKEAANKVAVINKIVQGYPVDAKSSGLPEREFNDLCRCRQMALDAAENTPELPDDVLRQLSSYSLPEVFSSTCASGLMQLTTPETTKVIMYKSYPGKQIPSDILDKMVVMQQPVLDLLAEHPQILDQLQESHALDLGVENVRPEIQKALRPYAEKRAGIGAYLKRRFVPEPWRNEVPNTTPLTITDPVSGVQYGTTRGAAVRAHDEIAKRNLYKVLGGAALLGGAYKAIGHGLDVNKLSKFKPLAALGLGYLGLVNIPSMGEHYMTDQGIPIPSMTELTKVSAADKTLSIGIPLLGSLGLMAALGTDYKSRLQSGIPLNYPGLPLSRRILDQVGSFSNEHPILAAAGGTLFLNRAGKTLPGLWAAKVIRKNSPGMSRKIDAAKNTAYQVMKGLEQGVKVSAYIPSAILDSQDTVMLPKIDLDKVAEWLGWVICES